MIGESISKLRQERNLSQEELAESIGVSVGAVEKYEENIWRPGQPILARMAILWGITVQELIQWEFRDNNQ
jgi:transcriptional regulator with XRE-family HTH domain